jgi:hypothetical protein
VVGVVSSAQAQTAAKVVLVAFIILVIAKIVLDCSKNSV